MSEKKTTIPVASKFEKFMIEEMRRQTDALQSMRGWIVFMGLVTLVMVLLTGCGMVIEFLSVFGY